MQMFTVEGTQKTVNCLENSLMYSAVHADVRILQYFLLFTVVVVVVNLLVFYTRRTRTTRKTVFVAGHAEDND